MKKIRLANLFIISFVLATPVLNAQKVASYQSKWHEGLMKGHEEELINRMQLEEKSQFLFLISNDEKNLYIDLVTADRASVQKIMRYGMTTWINPDGKTKKALGIEFPVSSEGQGEPNFARDKNADRKEMRLAMMASKNQDMTLTGFGGKGEQRSVDPGNDPSFRGKVEMLEGGRLYIHLELPLDQVQRSDLASFSSPLSIGFETGYMDVTGSGMPSGGGQNPGGGGMGGPGMYGGGPPGGMPPGSMGGSGDQQQERPDVNKLASPTRLWIKQVMLSQKQ
jgi:hypothetical protein